MLELNRRNISDQNQLKFPNRLHIIFCHHKTIVVCDVYSDLIFVELSQNYYCSMSPTTKSLVCHYLDLNKVQSQQFFFAIFILYSRESELYRYILDGTSALTRELPFPRCLGHLSSTQRWGRPVKCLAQGHNKQTFGLLSSTSPKYRSPRKEAVDTIFKVCWYDSPRGMNPRSTYCGVDALTTTLSRRFLC